MPATLTTLSQFSQQSILHQGGIQLTEFHYAKLCGYMQSTVPIQLLNGDIYGSELNLSPQCSRGQLQLVGVLLREKVRVRDFPLVITPNRNLIIGIVLIRHIARIVVS